MAFSEELAKEIWYRALNEEIGLALTLEENSNSNIRQISNTMYDVRKNIGDPNLEKLTIALVEGGEVWLVKNEVELE